MPSPLGAASDAVGSYVEKRDTNRDKALALSMEREKMANDERHKTRELDLKQQSVESEVKSRDSQTKIAEAQEEYRKRVEPILFETAQQHLAGVKAETISAQSKAIVDKADAELKQRLHDAGLDMKQAELVIQQTRQSIATSVAQQHQAEAATTREKSLLPGEIKQQGATLNQTNALTNYYNRNPGGAGGSSSTPSTADTSKLSDTGRQFYEMLFSTNNPATPQQAKLAIDNPKNKLTPEDRQILTEFVMSKHLGLPQTVKGRTPKAAPKADRNALTEVQSAHAAGQTDDEIIKNTLIAHRYSPVQAQAAIDAYNEQHP